MICLLILEREEGRDRERKHRCERETSINCLRSALPGESNPHLLWCARYHSNPQNKRSSWVILFAPPGPWLSLVHTNGLQHRHWVIRTRRVLHTTRVHSTASTLSDLSRGITEFIWSLARLTPWTSLAITKLLPCHSSQRLLCNLAHLLFLSREREEMTNGHVINQKWTENSCPFPDTEWPMQPTTGRARPNPSSQS